MFYAQHLLAKKAPLAIFWQLGNGRSISGAHREGRTASVSALR